MSHSVMIPVVMIWARVILTVFPPSIIRWTSWMNHETGFWTRSVLIVVIIGVPYVIVAHKVALKTAVRGQNHNRFKSRRSSRKGDNDKIA